MYKLLINKELELVQSVLNKQSVPVGSRQAIDRAAMLFFRAGKIIGFLEGMGPFDVLPEEFEAFEDKATDIQDEAWYLLTGERW